MSSWLANSLREVVTLTAYVYIRAELSIGSLYMFSWWMKFTFADKKEEDNNIILYFIFVQKELLTFRYLRFLLFNTDMTFLHFHKYWLLYLIHQEEGVNITANSLHPGSIITNLLRYHSFIDGNKNNSAAQLISDSFYILYVR